MSPKTTPLIDCHRESQAYLVEFAGTLLPLRYSSEREEHLAVRRALGMFDVSHMGEFVISGVQAYPYLQSLLTNNLNKLEAGQAQYSLILNHQGGIIDDLIVYKFSNEYFMLCVNAANIDTDWQCLTKHAQGFTQLELKNVSDDYAQIAVQGPQAINLLSTLSDTKLPKKFRFKRLKLASIDVIAAHTGYTGEAGLEIFLAPMQAPRLWRLLLKHGQAFGLKPCGLAARDSLRLEAGMLLHGSDIDETTSPLEAGLSWIVDLAKDDFIGKKALIAQQAAGITKKLVGFRLLERGIARHGFSIHNSNHETIGQVSSGSWLPGHDYALGLAYVSAKHAKLGSEILIIIRDRPTRAVITAGI